MTDSRISRTTKADASAVRTDARATVKANAGSTAVLREAECFRCGAGVCAGDGAVFGDRHGDGVDDRLGDLHCVGGYVAGGGIAGAADRGVAGDGADDGDRGAELWGAGGDDAEGRRAVCVSARGAGAALGISVWVDAVSGDPDRDDCGGGRGVWEVSGRVLSQRERATLDLAYCDGAGGAGGADGPGQYGHWAEYGESDGDCGDYAADGAEYVWRAAGRGGAECVHLGEGAGAGGGGAGGRDGEEPGGDGRELWRG